MAIFTPEMPTTPHSIQDRSIIALKGLRTLFAFLMGAWLFLVPMVTFTSSMVAFCDEYGASPIPLVEEEEAKHVGTSPYDGWMGHDRQDMRNTDLPLWEEFPHCSLYGDVLLQPPRRA
ncbi:MAG: hypothetical protein KDC00_06110 [Flavobacteriales bacterium]|nr:hypothetical protein [Flavobacteriales bacterium]